MNHRRFSQRKSFRLDDDTCQLLEQVSRNCFGKESTLIRKYVRAGVLEDAERYANETKRVLESTLILKHTTVWRTS